MWADVDPYPLHHFPLEHATHHSPFIVDTSLAYCRKFYGPPCGLGQGEVDSFLWANASHGISVPYEMRDGQ
jgi:hypothetical protein